MQIVISLVFFVFGTVIGSFLNVCIFRIPEKESVSYPASHCMACGHPLGFLDLIPILSYLFGGGRCRYCHRPISPQYIIIETITGALYGAVYLLFGISAHAMLLILFFSVLLVVAGIDLHHMYIPDGAVLLLLAVAGGDLVLKLVAGHFSIAFVCAAFLLSGILLFICIIGFLVFRKEAMGMGDVKLVFPIGLLLGIRNGLMCLYFSFIIGAAVSIGLLFLNKKKFGSQIPFGPYIVAASIIVLLFGDVIWNAYLGYVFGL